MDHQGLLESVTAQPISQVRPTHAVIVLVDVFRPWSNGTPAPRYASTASGYRDWLSLAGVLGIPRTRTRVLVQAGDDDADGYDAVTPSLAAIQAALTEQFKFARATGGTLLFCYSGRATSGTNGPTLLASDSTDVIALGQHPAPTKGLATGALQDLLNDVSTTGILAVTDARSFTDECVQPVLRAADRHWWLDERPGGGWKSTGDPLRRILVGTNAVTARDKIEPVVEPGSPQVGSEHFLRYHPAEEELELAEASSFGGAALYVMTKSVSGDPVVCGYLLLAGAGDYGNDETWAFADGAFADTVRLWPVLRKKENGQVVLAANTASSLLHGLGAIDGNRIRLAKVRQAANLTHSASYRWVGYGNLALDVPPATGWFELRAADTPDGTLGALVRAGPFGRPDFRPESWFRAGTRAEIISSDHLVLRKLPVPPPPAAYQGLLP